jgi:hypothetical protein
MKSTRASLLLLCIHHCCPVGSFSASTSKHAVTKHSSQQQTPLLDSVQVFDNVFSIEVCEELHHLAVDHAERCESSIFYLDSQSDQRDDGNYLLTPLEQALRSCLQQLPAIPNDKNRIVEYWCRDEHMNMDVHADIDEQELLNEGTLRYPDFGHVLYLEVGSTVRGPTCVFSKYGGWDENDDGDDSSVSLVSVPAVAGRVLRFPGHAMHAVPKPSMLWLFDKEEQRKALDEQDEIAGGEDRRSVILFNVWTNHGPLGVLEDIDKGVIPDGIEIDDDDEETDGSGRTMDRQKEERLAHWEEEHGEDCCDLWCQARNAWEEVTIVDNSGAECTEALLVRLMGNSARRLHPKKLAQLRGPSMLRQALQDEKMPHHYILKSEPTD